MLVLLTVLALCLSSPEPGQDRSGPPAHSGSASAPAVIPSAYVIGPQDVLGIVFWRDRDMSADSVVVRPDGNISLPLLNDVRAAGLTPDQLRERLNEAAKKYVEDPNATVVVREIHSRNVYITGNVSHAGTFPLADNMTVLQLIALAGGLQEYADSKHILVIRIENGKQQYLKFNYSDVIKRKQTAQNILLKPGDTVVVP